MATRNGLTSGNWIALAAVILTALAIGGAVAGYSFFGRAEGEALQVRVEIHEREQTKTESKQAETNKGTKSDSKEMQQQMQRMDRNIVRIGARLRVKELEDGTE